MAPKRAAFTSKLKGVDEKLKKNVNEFKLSSLTFFGLGDQIFLLMKSDRAWYFSVHIILGIGRRFIDESSRHSFVFFGWMTPVHF